MKVDYETRAYAKLRDSGCTMNAENWTEADTRSKFIDEVVIQCLGWPEAEIRRELYSDNGRLDYVLSIIQPKIVIEAKRASIQLPGRDTPAATRVKIKNHIRSNPALRPHLKQVRNYCLDRSIPLAVLTNGSTYIAFLALRTDGIPWEEGDMIYFRDIFDERFNFAEFQNLLSRNAILEGHLQTRLLSKSTLSSPRDVVSTYPDPNVFISSNPLGRQLEPIIHPIFTAVADDNNPDILKHCYVVPSSHKPRNLDYERLLHDDSPSYAPDATSLSKRNTFDEFKSTIKNYISHDSQPQTVILIGGIGVGKTTFIRRFFEIEAPNDTQDPDFGTKTLYFYINFQRPGLEPNQIPCLIFERLREQIEALDSEPVQGEKKNYDLLSTAGLQHIFLKNFQKFKRNEGSIEKSDPAYFKKLKLEFLANLRDDDRQFV